jgi:hypothetical protein
MPRLRLGYVEMVNANGFSLRAGQDWTPVAQQNPNTLDYGILAWSGNIFNRAPQITARYKAGAVETLLSVMHARVAGRQDQQEQMPWVMGRVAWTGLMEGRGLLALGGGYRQNSLTNAAGTVQNDSTNYLVALEARLPLCSSVTATAEGWTGTGVGADFTRTGFDYDATGEEMEGSGGFVNLEWKTTEKVSLNVGVGVDQPSDEDTTTATIFGTAVPYDSNQTAFANIRYQASKQLGFGFEVMHMETELAENQVGGDDGNQLRGQRFTFGSWFIF